jgi:predicted DNA-binding WGR domain protein
MMQNHRRKINPSARGEAQLKAFDNVQPNQSRFNCKDLEQTKRQRLVDREGSANSEP